MRVSAHHYSPNEGLAGTLREATGESGRVLVRDLRHVASGHLLWDKKESRVRLGVALYSGTPIYVVPVYTATPIYRGIPI